MELHTEIYSAHYVFALVNQVSIQSQ